MLGNEGESEDQPLLEYWIVAFQKAGNERKYVYRQFLAEGYYEAYDIVMTFAEKTSYRILWFKEKRNSGIEFREKLLSNLEFICTFCNKKFNNIEPIKCNYRTNGDMRCKSEFCSLICKEEHFYFMHIRRGQ
ncbi:MAG TPA: hypothetical protein VJR94_02145 [Candidatus Nitrosocosmicus sp.]|nr:hypothetical protein [Candidatus Nitrosocosmicus sp.]